MQADTEQRPGYLVKQVQQLLRTECDRRLRGGAIGSMSQYAVLRALADRPGASSAEVARRCFVTRQSLQDVLTGLRKAGLVAVGTPASGRSRPVELTTVGRSALRTAERTVRDVENQMIGEIAADDRKALVNALMRCAENLAR